MPPKKIKTVTVTDIEVQFDPGVQPIVVTLLPTDKPFFDKDGYLNRVEYGSGEVCLLKTAFVRYQRQHAPRKLQLNPNPLEHQPDE